MCVCTYSYSLHVFYSPPPATPPHATLLALTSRSHCKSKHRRHPTHRTVQHLPDVGWSQNLDLPPSAARPALPRGEITRFPPPRSACSRPFLAVSIQNLKKNGPRETAAATLPRLCRRAPGRLPQPLGTRGRPLTDFGQPPPASSRAAPGTPALWPAACCVARFWAVSPQKRPPPVPSARSHGHETR